MPVRLLRWALAAIALAALLALTTGAVWSQTVDQQLSGRFSQERHLKGFAAPLVSHGRFLLVAGRGLVWRVSEPFEIVTVITPDGITQMVEGTRTLALPASRLPRFDRFYDLLAAAISGRLTELGKDFQVEHIEGQPGPDGSAPWRVRLSSKAHASLLGAAVAAVEVAGSQHVESVRIERTSGDWEMLKLFDQRRGTAPLGAADRALLKPAR